MEPDRHSAKERVVVVPRGEPGRSTGLLDRTARKARRVPVQLRAVPRTAPRSVRDVSPVGRDTPRALRLPAASLVSERDVPAGAVSVACPSTSK